MKQLLPLLSDESFAATIAATNYYFDFKKMKKRYVKQFAAAIVTINDYVLKKKKDILAAANSKNVCGSHELYIFLKCYSFCVA